MRQRTELYGGTVTADPRADGGFAVTATIPLDDVPTPAVPQR
jgi:signal transduction histidine kinase